MTSKEWHHIDNYICEYLKNEIFPTLVSKALAYIYQSGYPTFNNFDECIMTLNAYFSISLKSDYYDLINHILRDKYHLEISSKNPLQIKRSHNG